MTQHHVFFEIQFFVSCLYNTNHFKILKKASRMKIIPTLQELCSLVGQEISVSDWLTIEQSRIDQFAQATGDHQWIHTDPAKAANGPFKTTIAHGFLTLSLLEYHHVDC